ncbi:MAG TPA: NUDIX hydrolase [Candidatus Saccharimonadales bacterium]|nr:NUDIX hydrolase [Candidatus Saccharimonadales bacterium]
MKPQKQAVSLVIRDDQGRFLVVKRPNSAHDELAGVWGFPAATLREGELELEGCQRIARTKLGIKVEIGRRIGNGRDERKAYHLSLTDYEAKISEGTPNVPQSDTSVTQYDECKFTDNPALLYPAAQKGSLCTQVFLKSIGKNWGEL